MLHPRQARCNGALAPPIESAIMPRVAESTAGPHRPLKPAVVVLAALALAGLAAACGGGGSKSPTSTAAPAGTAVSTLPAGYIRISSSAKGYSMVTPTNWVPKQDAFTSGGVKADEYIAGISQTSNFVTNVSVLCRPLTGPSTSAEWQQASLDNLRSAGVQPSVDEQVTAGGQSVNLITYNTTQGSTGYEVAQVFFVGGQCGWVLTLSAASGERATYLPTFAAMYGSYQVTGPPATPSAGAPTAPATP